MAFNRSFVDVELTDGTQHEGVRVTWADKCAAERTMSNRGWKAEDNNFLLTGLLAWLALKRLGHTAAGWDEFKESLVDAFMYTPDEDADPTPAE